MESNSDKVYLVSEEVLRQVLDALIHHDGNYKLSRAAAERVEEAMGTLRAILAKEPQEPVAWYRMGAFFPQQEGDEREPLYRKDA